MTSTFRLVLLWISPLIFGLVVGAVAYFVLGASIELAGFTFIAGFAFDHLLHRLVFRSALKAQSPDNEIG